MQEETIVNIEVLAQDNIRTLKLPSASFEHPACMILVGFPGSGKSLLTKRLREKFPLVTFSEQTMTAFLAPRASVLHRGKEKVFQLTLKTIELLVKQGKACVYDGNVKEKEQRWQIKKIVEEAGGKYVLIYISTNKEICYKRIKKQNLSINRGESKGFIMDKDFFEYEVATTKIPVGEERHINFDGQSEISLNEVVSVLKEIIK